MESILGIYQSNNICNIIFIHPIGKVERVVSDLLRLDAGGGLDYQVTAHLQLPLNIVKEVHREVLKLSKG